MQSVRPESQLTDLPVPDRLSVLRQGADAESGKLRKRNRLMGRAIQHRLEFLVFRLAVCLVDCLSARTAARWADRLATFFCDWLPEKWTRSHVVYENLRRAFGQNLSDAELRRLRHGMWVHLFRTVIEMVQSPRKLHLHNYRRIVEIVGLPAANNALLSGRRVLMLGGHFGSWETGMALFGL